uniref:Uncharacterized protein n=1 Tax=Romanomermis culicivorax TaxID=13658 RepID=A0A915JTA3_ROMCU
MSQEHFKQDHKFNFPVRLEFVAMIVFCFGEKEPIQKLPFTFDVKNFSNEFLQLDPDGCGKQFSIGFSVNDDFHSDGDILLNITFVHPSISCQSVRTMKLKTCDNIQPTLRNFSKEKFYTARSRKKLSTRDERHLVQVRSIKVKQVGRFVTDKLLSFNVTIPDSISKTRFITVDGDVAITNAHCIGIYSEVDVVGIYRRMEFIEYVDNHLSSDIPVIGNIASFVRQATDLIVGLFGRPLGCFIHTGDKMKQMSHGQFTNDDYKLNFPIRPEFVAMIVFHFVKEEPIKLFINSVHYCTFEPLNTKEIPHRMLTG